MMAQIMSKFMLLPALLLGFLAASSFGRLWLGMAWEWVSATWNGGHVAETPYQVSVFNRDPMMLYIRDFLSKEEMAHIINLVETKFETSRIWTDEVGYVDETLRASESADVPRTDVVRRIEKRARRFMGWRNNSTRIQPLKVQKFNFNGFYTFHYDWVDYDTPYAGNRMTTFMVYIEADCEGGGTNFPRVQPPDDKRWCDVIACEGDVEYEEYPGVTFKPIAGSAVFWENFHPNGTPHTGTRHAALPVRSGRKMGMNVWSWDESWTLPKTD